MLKCENLLCEYLENPISIDEIHPRFSWKIKSDSQNVKQTAYEISVYGVWETGKVDSETSVHIPYNGEPLKPQTEYSYKVRIWGNYGNVSSWTYGSFETGLMGYANWSAEWIEPAISEIDSVPALCKEFTLESNIKKARIYVTCYGIYELFLNGERVCDQYFAPGFTSYHKRLQYQTYNVTPYLNEGNNKLEIYLANGWCCGCYPFGDRQNVFNTMIAALMQMTVEYANGSSQTIITDDSWKCHKTPILFSEFYDGESYDARLEGQAMEYFPVNVSSRPYDNITAQESEPVRIIDTVRPLEIISTPKGETVIDFGQNMVGWAEFTVSGKKGDKVIIKHAEVLDKYGNFYVDNLRTAKQTVEYTLKGENTETYHPHFSFQGFRYIKIENFPKKPELSDFFGKVICSDLKRIGYFECSHPLVNRLYQNVIWGQRGNFVDIPTDCPQRDERVGWTGDAQVFISTAVQNMNVALFFKKWLRDLWADQTEEIGVPIFIPAMFEDKTSAAWGDAATICPWEIYLAYGDEKLLNDQYKSMKEWVEYTKRQGNNPYLWTTGYQFGDWLGLDAEEGSYTGATSKHLIATAFYSYSVSLIVKAAKVLGLPEDIKTYETLNQNIKDNFRRTFVKLDGELTDFTQTAYVLALNFDLVENKEQISRTLDKMIKNNGNRLTTGFVGTPYLCNTLVENGYAKTAYDLLLQEEYPSWLYSVNKGATTIWEHWDGIKPNGDFWSPDMNSFNHYAYGSIADYLYKKCAGIYQKEAGYKDILVKPILDERITYVKASIDTPYGIVSSDWKTEGGIFSINVNIPHNTTAVIIMPDGTHYDVGSGNYCFSQKIL